jgi:hypothetical protein
MYCTFAFITDCVTFTANRPIVPGDSWHRCQTGKTPSCLPPSSGDVNVWSFTVTFLGTLMLGEFYLNSLSDFTNLSKSSQSLSSTSKMCVSSKPVQNMPVVFKVF